jgi:hypothetical protein
MLIYRFRFWSDTQEDLLREIEIQPGQTFLDFHEAIISSADFDRCEKAFFYTTDKKYKKHQEISLKHLKKQIRKYDEEEGEMVTETFVPHLMKDSRLRDYIEDPHQKMLYEFHGRDFLIFNIELFKIYKTEETFILPRVVKSAGDLPKRVEIPMAPVVAPPEEESAIHVPLVAGGIESLFAGMHEDDAELAGIESELGGLLSVEDEMEDESVGSSVDGEEESEFGAEEEEGHMESIDDYEDIEGLEIKHRDFSSDPDEF